MKKIITVFFTVFLFASASYAQLEDQLHLLDENEVKNYARPLVTSFASGMSAGAFNTADVPKFFGFSIGIRAMFIFVPDDQKYFTPNLPEGYVVDKDAPTVYGPGQGVTYLGGGSNPPIIYPEGQDVNALPLVFPQATISFFRTELLVRYITLPIEDEDITLFGIGLKHNVSQYIPLMPVDVSVQILYNKLKISDIIDAKHLAYGLIVSKSLAIVTFYGGFQFENSTFNFSYEYDDGNTTKNIDVDIDGDNDVRGTLGAAIKLPFFVINADYSFGAQNAVSTGLSLQF